MKPGKLLRATRWAAFCFLATAAFHGTARAGEVFERPWMKHGTPYAVALTTFSYTMIPPAANSPLSNRTDMLVANPSANNATMWGHIGNCTSTAVSTSTVKGPLKFYTTGTEKSVPLGPNECLWVISGHTSTESILYQETSQLY